MIERLWVSLANAVSGDAFWESYLKTLTDGGSRSFAVHVAVLQEPFLRYILDGRKTIESRFSSHRIAPYRRVETGDVVLLKRSGGPIAGICLVSGAWFYRLDPATWQEIRTEFTAALCTQDPSFWEKRQAASFASLMRIDNVRAIDSVHYTKRDRRGWVLLIPPAVLPTPVAL